MRGALRGPPESLGLSSDDLARAQFCDRVRVVAERRQHLLGVGAERWRHAVEPAAAMGELKTAAGEAQAEAD